MTRSRSRSTEHRASHWRVEVRTFAAGAGCGFLAGALLVATLLWRFDAIRWDRSPGLHDLEHPGAAVLEPASPAPTGTSGRARSKPAIPPETPLIGPDPTKAPAELKDRDLLIPVEGVKADHLTRQFSDRRGGSRAHEAIDILAPRNTPVKAVEDGKIARLFYSKAGGITIYQFDPSTTFCYYYAHLERYAEGLGEGSQVQKGDVIGYVGTSGNAPKDTPHLHFAIFRLTEAKHWWEGSPIDPYDVLR
jgi:murein DD-endopeptidase MepM/ murein hydrolase activator NlpD